MPRTVRISRPVLSSLRRSRCIITSTALLPQEMSALAGTAASWLLTAAVGAIGLKTGFGELRAARPSLAIAMLCQTLFQLAVVCGLVLWIGR